jgi:hypothetical protein
VIHLLADPLVDWAALWKVVWVSFLAGVGVMIAFSLAVLGASRAGDYRRVDQPVIAAGFTVLTVAALAVCAFMLYHGYLFVVHKS